MIIGPTLLHVLFFVTDRIKLCFYN